MRLRYFYRPHRWREVAPRRHPVPDLVQIVLQIGFEVLDGTPVHPRCTLIVLDLLPRLLTDTLNEEDRDGLGEWDGVMVRLDRGHGGVVVVIVSRRPVACSCVGERDGCGRRGAGFGRAGAGIGGCGSAGRAAGEEPAPAQDVDQRPAAQARKGPGGVDHPQLVVDVLAVAFGQDPEIVDPRGPSARAGWAWGGQVQYEPAGRAATPSA